MSVALLVGTLLVAFTNKQIGAACCCSYQRQRRKHTIQLVLLISMDHLTCDVPVSQQHILLTMITATILSPAYTSQYLLLLTHHARTGKTRRMHALADLSFSTTLSMHRLFACLDHQFSFSLRFILLTGRPGSVA